ncbi:MAG: MutS-related protein [Nocardioidaceae bacterium]
MFQRPTVPPEHASATQLPSLLFSGRDVDAMGMPGPVQPLDCFTDLKLDHVEATLVQGREQYKLDEYFRRPLTTVESVTYRQAIFRDLEHPETAAYVTEFGRRMQAMRDQLARGRKHYYPVQQQRTFLTAATTYVDAVSRLRDRLGEDSLDSEGLRSVLHHLSGYVDSAAFVRLSRDADETRHFMAGLQYRIRVYGDTVQVSAVDENTEDYSRDVARTFERFRQGPARSYLSKLHGYGEMDHVEATIADFVAQLHPDAFEALAAFARRHLDFVDPGVRRLDREIQFYLAYVDLMARVTQSGLTFCCPTLSAEPDAIAVSDAYDLALASQRAADASVVTNDIHAEAWERVLVVTGPNQGGKTTFARMFGQLHYLASLGVPVPGSQAALTLPDTVQSLFEQGENVADMRGHLHDDLVRIHEMLEISKDRTVLVVNEIFTSTALDDATFLSTKILNDILRRGTLCVFVTFMDELSVLSPSTASLVAEVDPNDTDHRTFKIVRRPADGLAHAQAVAARHGLGYDTLMSRLQA